MKGKDYKEIMFLLSLYISFNIEMKRLYFVYTLIIMYKIEI